MCRQGRWLQPHNQVQISSYLHHLLPWHHRMRHFSSLHSPVGISYTDPSASSGNYDQCSSPPCWLPHHCQDKEIAVSTVITYHFLIIYHFLKGCSFSTHTAHRGVKHWQQARRVVFGRKEHPDIFRTKHCSKKRQIHHIASSYTEHIPGGRNAADPTSSHHRTSC